MWNRASKRILSMTLALALLVTGVSASYSVKAQETTLLNQEAALLKLEEENLENKVIGFSDDEEEEKPDETPGGETDKEEEEIEGGNQGGETGSGGTVAGSEEDETLGNSFVTPKEPEAPVITRPEIPSGFSNRPMLAMRSPMPLNDGYKLIYNYTQLRDYVVECGADDSIKVIKVRFANDIATIEPDVNARGEVTGFDTTNFPIGFSKDLIVDGTHNNSRHKFIQSYNFYGGGNLCFRPMKEGVNLTLKNMDLDLFNPYGVIYSTQRDTTLTLENVSGSGRKIAQFELSAMDDKDAGEEDSGDDDDEEDDGKETPDNPDDLEDGPDDGGSTIYLVGECNFYLSRYRNNGSGDTAYPYAIKRYIPMSYYDNDGKHILTKVTDRGTAGNMYEFAECEKMIIGKGEEKANVTITGVVSSSLTSTRGYSVFMFRGYHSLLQVSEGSALKIHAPNHRGLEYFTRNAPGRGNAPQFIVEKDASFYYSGYGHGISTARSWWHSVTIGERATFVSNTHYGVNTTSDSSARYPLKVRSYGDDKTSGLFIEKDAVVYLTSYHNSVGSGYPVLTLGNGAGIQAKDPKFFGLNGHIRIAETSDLKVGIAARPTANQLNEISALGSRIQIEARNLNLWNKTGAAAEPIYIKHDENNLVSAFDADESDVKYKAKGIPLYYGYYVDSATGKELARSRSYRAAYGQGMLDIEELSSYNKEITGSCPTGSDEIRVRLTPNTTNNTPASFEMTTKPKEGIFKMTIDTSGWTVPEGYGPIKRVPVVFTAKTTAPDPKESDKVPTGQLGSPLKGITVPSTFYTGTYRFLPHDTFFIWTESKVNVKDPGEMSLEVPDNLNFGTVQYAGYTKKYGLAENAGSKITVKDTRRILNPDAKDFFTFEFDLTAQAGFLKAKGTGATLAQSSIGFVKDQYYRLDGNPIKITDSVECYDTPDDDGTYSFDLNENDTGENQIVMKLDPYEIEMNESYSTSITWTLSAKIKPD